MLQALLAISLPPLPTSAEGSHSWRETQGIAVPIKLYLGALESEVLDFHM